MEAESADTWSRNYKNYKSILDYEDETMQSGAGFNSAEEDLFGSPLRVDDIDEMEIDGQTSFKLSPPAIDYTQIDKKAELYDQRSLLINNNILRPRLVTNSCIWSASNSVDKIGVQSESGKNSMNREIDQNDDESAYVLGPDQSHYYIDFMPRMEALDINSPAQTSYREIADATFDKVQVPELKNLRLN